MRHRQAGKKLSRNHHQRQALFKQQAGALVINESVMTTEAKAKLLVRLMDKLITKAKKGTLSARRQLLAFMSPSKAANKLVDDIAQRNPSRQSGFTKMIRLGVRRGDNAMIAKVELMDKPLPKKK
ncbi:MAG: 50S ribosomal protein L17 [Candidatus Beckwithbacteria bacterium]